MDLGTRGRCLRVMEEATGLTMPEHRGREGKVLRVLLSGRCYLNDSSIVNSRNEKNLERMGFFLA